MQEIKLGYKIDSQGYYLAGQEIVNYLGTTTNLIITTRPPNGFYRPKWDGTKWIEGGAAPAPTRTFLLSQLVEMASRAQDRLTEGYTSTERDTWERKEAEAKAILAGDLSAAKYLQVEVIAMVGSDSGPALIELARVILAKSDQLRQASAQIAGIRARHYAALESAADPAAYWNSIGQPFAAWLS